MYVAYFLRRTMLTFTLLLDWGLAVLSFGVQHAWETQTSDLGYCKIVLTL